MTNQAIFFDKKYQKKTKFYKKTNFEKQKN